MNYNVLYIIIHPYITLNITLIIQPYSYIETVKLALNLSHKLVNVYSNDTCNRWNANFIRNVGTNILYNLQFLVRIRTR